MATDRAEAHQADQATLVDLLLQALVPAWGLLDVHRLKATLPDLVHAVAALVHRFGLMSGSVAADFYDAERRAAGVTGRYTVTPVDPPGVEQVQSGVEWATHNLWGADPDTDAARTLVEGVAEDLVLGVGRDTLIEASHGDRKAKGWARVAEPGACAFCLMLATRGAVYSERSADFQSHPNCRCHAIPVFTAYEPPADIRRWQQIYRESTRNTSGAASLRAFRRAVAAERGA